MTIFFGPGGIATIDRLLRRTLVLLVHTLAYAQTITKWHGTQQSQYLFNTQKYHVHAVAIIKIYISKW